MADKLVFDIETKNSFQDVGGENNIEKLEASIIGVYSYNQDKYFCFDENEFAQFGAMLKQASLLVGFSSKHFDVPVLKKYFNFNIAAIPHYDILEEIQKVYGRRIGLGLLANANVGENKTSHGLEAIAMYRNKEFARLKEYCLQDVKLTKNIFELIKNQGYLWIPQKNIPQMEKVNLVYNEIVSPQGQLL